MEFPLVNEKTNERYVRLYPRIEENEQLKAAATELGDPKMVQFTYGGNDPHWRLYENRIPSGVDADKHFGSFVSPEAQAAYAEERAKFKEGKESAERTTRSVSKEVPESDRFYPTRAMRAEFQQMSADSATKFRYRGDVGAFVHVEGPREGFEKFQTPEAKAVWVEEGKINKEKSVQVTSRAAEASEIVAERAAGNHFVADNFKGFMLPSVNQAEERSAQLVSLKQASDVEISRVFSTTETELKAAERKQYAVQINAAQKKDPALSTEAFNDMDPKGRREAAGFAGRVSNEDFAKLVGLKNGFFAMVDEMKERGLLKDREQVKEAQAEKGKSSSAPKGVGEKGQALKNEPAEKPKGRAASKGAAMAASLADGMQR